MKVPLCASLNALKAEKIKGSICGKIKKKTGVKTMERQSKGSPVGSLWERHVQTDARRSRAPFIPPASLSAASAKETDPQTCGRGSALNSCCLLSPVFARSKKEEAHKDEGPPERFLTSGTPAPVCSMELPLATVKNIRAAFGFNRW